MRYLITLTPLEPFFFGGDRTFGKLKDKDKDKDKNEEEGTYLVHSRKFPQQTAILGMIRKELLIQAGFLTTKRNGEWVDENKKGEATEFIGDTKFEFNQEQDFGVLKSLGAVFLMRNGEKFIKKVDIDSYIYEKDKPLEKRDFKTEKDKYFTGKDEIYDNFISLSSCKRLKSKAIFKEITQIGIKKSLAQDDKYNSYFKRTSYSLKHNFKFAFYIESDYELKDSFITLGAEKSTFEMSVTQEEESLEYQDKNGYLTLLSDAYIDIPIERNCEFAITSEISFNYLQNKFKGNKKTFKKSLKTRFLYEKGSVFIEPSDRLIKDLNNKNLQKIGLNQFSYNEGEK